MLQMIYAYSSNVVSAHIWEMFGSIQVSHNAWIKMQNIYVGRYRKVVRYRSVGS